MQHCTKVSRKEAMCLRPQSSVSLLAEQLKSSSLNETGNVVASTWWSQSRSDRLSDISVNLQPDMMCDVCGFGVSSTYTVTSTTEPCARVVGDTRPNDNTSEPVTGWTNEPFSSFSPYTASSVFSQGQSEPEEEETDQNWQFKRSHSDKTTVLFQQFSASAPTTEPAYTHHSSSVSSFNAFPSTNLPNQHLQTLVGKSMQSAEPPLICTCNAHLLPAKRACRSLSASASAQQQQQYLAHQSIHTHRNSQVIEAHLFEARFSTLPRPIAVRPTPGKVSLSDPFTTDKSNTLSSGCKPLTSNVTLRTTKQREYSQGSRLSWHHPVFTSGLGGAQVQHPSYGVHFACVAHSTITRPSQSSMHSTSVGEPNSCKQQPAETALASHAAPCIQCGLSNSSRMITYETCHSSAFIPTHTHSGSPNQAIQSSGYSLSPDADLSTASSLQLPVPTPSSGFHEASFSCLSEAFSLPDCSKIRSRHELPSMAVNNSHSKTIDAHTVARRDLCIESSSCTETVGLKMTESAIRCRSQPGVSSTKVDSNCSIQAETAPRAVPNVTGIATGLKRRHGPSMETFDSSRFNQPSGVCFMDPAWCLSPCYAASSTRTNDQNGTSPNQNDATLSRTGRFGSSYMDSISSCTPGSWNSSTEISPFRSTNGNGSGSGTFGPEVFVFGSYGARSEWDNQPDEYNDATIKRDSYATQHQNNSHVYPKCTLTPQLQIAATAPDKFMCIENSDSACLQWCSSSNDNTRPCPNLECEGDAMFANCRRHHLHHAFPQLTKLSESFEEDKDHETPKTMNTEDTGSMPNSIESRAVHPTIKSPSMHEVTFAPIQLARDHQLNASVVVEDLSHMCTGQLSEQVAQLHCHPGAPMKDIFTSGYGNEESNDGTELLLSLSSTDSDSSVDPDMLSPKLINRCKVKTQSLFPGPCPADGSGSSSIHDNPNPPYVELDLDLIEND